MNTNLFERVDTASPVDGLVGHPRPFAGSDYVPARDDVRLVGQLRRIWDVMKDGAWRSLATIATLTGAPPASVSAQLRHLRKGRCGSHVVQKAHLGGGLFVYRVER